MTKYSFSLFVFLLMLSCSEALADRSLSLLDNAYRLHNQNRHSEAIKTMEEALRLHPNQPELLLAHAHIAISADLYKQAIQDCDAVLKSNPKSAGAFSRRGYCYCRIGKYEKGISDLSRSIELKQIDQSGWDGPYDYQNRAKAYRHLGNSKLAERDEQIGRLLSSIDRARGYRNQIQLAQAVSIMNDAVSRDQNNLYLRYFRGIATMNDGQLATAISDLTFVILHDSACIAAYYFRADCYSRMHRMHDAINDYSKIIAKKPYVVAISDTAETGRCKGKELTYDETGVRLSDIYVLRARQYGLLKQHNNALIDFEQALSMDPGDSEARQELADLYLAMKKFPQAIQECNRIVSDDPKNWKVYEIRATVLEACKQPEKAGADYNKLIDMSGKDAGAFLLRGQFYDRIHQDLKAIADYTTVIKINPIEDDAFRGRGDSYFKIGKYTNAVDDYSRAIALDKTGNAAAFLLRALAYDKLGRTDLAQKDRQVAETSKNKKLGRAN
ncbi:hypothetical protein BH10CYA1_BH10CYA1_09680 [soil metagenome]